MKPIKTEKKAQVWIETMIYLLIGLSLLGTVLFFVRPKIQEYRDRIVLQQTIELFDQLDEKIQSVYYGGQGNKRIADIGIKRGQLIIDARENQLRYVLENSKAKYSEPGKDVAYGKFFIRTIQTSDKQYTVSLILNYSNEFNLFYENKSDSLKTLAAAPSPYRLSISYVSGDGITPQIDIIVTS